MRALDPRLLRRTTPARPLMAIDTALGIGSALAVLLQGFVLARIVAHGFHGAPLHRLWGDLVLLVVAFAIRGALGAGMAVAGHRAAWSVLSELRMAVVERRLASQPIAVDGTSGSELAAVAVQGVDGLEGYFARYLPQVVLASVVPFVVVAAVAVIDWESALIMLLTLPLVPVFMWLIGRYTEQRTRERWQALRRLSTHFLDVVRGLPTLRAFGRADDELATLSAVSERYRATTMATLRVSFLSGSVLELAATLGVALVAVTAGVRLVGGDVGLQTGLTVIILAPELYLPFRRLGAEYHASADGIAVAERMFALLDAPPAMPGGGPRPAPSPADGAGPVRAGLVHLSVAVGARARPVRPGAFSGRDGGPRRGERCRQEHRGGASARTPGAEGGTHLDRRRRSPRLRRRGMASPDRLGPPAPDAVARQRGGQHPARRSGRRGSPGARCGGSRGSARVHRPAARRLRDARRRRGPGAVARRAPPDRAGAGLPARRRRS